MTKLAESSLEIDSVSGNFLFLPSRENQGFLLHSSLVLPLLHPHPPKHIPLITAHAVRLPSVQKLPLWGQNTEVAYMPVGDDVGFVTHCNSILVNTTTPSSATF